MISILFIPVGIFVPLSYSITMGLDQIRAEVKEETNKEKANEIFKRFRELTDFVTTEMSLNTFYFFLYLILPILRERTLGVCISYFILGVK